MIDIEKFICSLMRFTPVSKEVKYLINCALKDQGLEFKDGKIVLIDNKPKFKKGDRVVYCNEDVDSITGIEENGYTINEGGFIPFACEDSMQLWDITLAKDGDVLADGVGIILFRKIGNEKYADVVDYHCVALTRGKFEIQEGFEYWGDVIEYDLHPATKEQRDTLYKAMHESGYEWDAEHKQLRKIEPKKEPTEFERGYKQAIEDAVRYMDKVWGLNILGNSIDDFRETMEQKLKELSQG